MTGSPDVGRSRQDRHVHPLRRRSVTALLTGLLGASVLAGCSGGDHTQAASDDFAQWMSTASAQLGQSLFDAIVVTRGAGQ